jgi:hypothetical protein
VGEASEEAQRGDIELYEEFVLGAFSYWDERSFR